MEKLRLQNYQNASLNTMVLLDTLFIEDAMEFSTMKSGFVSILTKRQNAEHGRMEISNLLKRAFGQGADQSSPDFKPIGPRYVIRFVIGIDQSTQEDFESVELWFGHHLGTLSVYKGKPFAFSGHSNHNEGLIS